MTASGKAALQKTQAGGGKLTDCGVYFLEKNQEGQMTGGAIFRPFAIRYGLTDSLSGFGQRQLTAISIDDQNRNRNRRENCSGIIAKHPEQGTATSDVVGEFMNA